MLFDALQFVKDYGIAYEADGSSVWVNIPCPMCGRDDFKGGLNTNGGYYHCWVCGSTHITKVISTLLEVSYGKSKEIYNEYLGHSSLRASLNGREKKTKAKKVDLPGESLNKYQRKYLEKRNFDPDYLEWKYKLRGTPPVYSWNGSDFSKRIIIPFFDKHGDLVSFQGRAHTKVDHKYRYKGAPLEFCVENYKDLLYNANNCLGDTICLVEGAPDVWRMGDGFLGSFGISMTRRQIKLLSEYKRVFIMFDPEPEAQEQAKKLMKTLSTIGKDVENIILDSGGRDAGELSDTEAKEIRRELGFS